jgi:RimJ/RimL family protein N-acetyltransferase
MLRGKRVVLRPIKRADKKLFLKWFNDLEVIRNLTLYLPTTEASEEKWIEETMTQRRPIFVIEVVLASGKRKPIGNCGFHNIEEKDRVATFGICIGEKKFWGHGYGTEAAKLLIDYGFKFMNLHKIESNAWLFNEKSVRMHKKLGFVVEGQRRERKYIDGKYQDSVVFGLLKSEWLSQ